MSSSRVTRSTRGSLVEASASEKRINEGVEADFGKGPRAFGRDVAKECAHDTLRKIVRFNGSVKRHFAEPWGKVPVSTDDLSNESSMGEVIESARVSITLAGAVHEGEVSRGAVREESLLERRGEEFGMAGTNKAADRDGTG
jgi:hypothetical protein